MSSTQISTSLAVSENGFLFLPTTGETFTVNETGRFILRRLQEGREQQEIISSLIDEFDVEPVDAQRDVLDFIGQLRQYHLTDTQ